VQWLNRVGIAKGATALAGSRLSASAAVVRDRAQWGGNTENTLNGINGKVISFISKGRIDMTFVYDNETRVKLNKYRIFLFKDSKSLCAEVLILILLIFENITHRLS